MWVKEIVWTWYLLENLEEGVEKIYEEKIGQHNLVG